MQRYQVRLIDDWTIINDDLTWKEATAFCAELGSLGMEAQIERDVTATDWHMQGGE